MMRRLRGALASVVVIVLLASCTGGGDEDADAEVLPLPASAPSTAGPARGPEMVPKVLLASADELEESLGSVDAALVERRSGAFVSGSTVVGYSVDNISGYDLVSGETRWTAELDLDGGTVCLVSQPDRDVKNFTVAYGDSGFCNQIATLRVSDGTVVKTFDSLETIDGFDGTGPVNQLFTLEGVDYIIDFGGIVSRMSKGVPKKIAQLEHDSYFKVFISPEAPLLLAVPLDREDPSVEAYSLPSFEQVWSQDQKTLFPASAETDEDSVISLVRGNGLWLSSQINPSIHMVQLDPKDGSVIGSAQEPVNAKSVEGTFSVGYGALLADTTLGLPDGDVVFPQVGGMMRYSLAREEVVWSLNLQKLELESEDEFSLVTTAPMAITSDQRHVIAAISNTTAVEIVAIDVKTGELDARWPVPAEFRNGFQVEPKLTLFDEGVVLNRNFEKWDFEFADYLDREPPPGERYDIGVFTFPEVDERKSDAVPVTGPADAEATALGGGLKTKNLPEPGPETVVEGTSGQVLHFANGSRVIAVTGEGAVSVDTVSGKRDWSTPIAPEPVNLCDTSRPDRRAKSFLVSYVAGDSEDGCSGLVRIAATSGKVIDRFEATSKDTGFSRIISYDGADFVVSGDKKVRRIEKGKLVEHATLEHRMYTSALSAQDSSLLVVSSVTSDDQMDLDAYQLPSFTKVWSTTAKKVFGATPDRGSFRSWITAGLNVSGGFGGSDDELSTSNEVAQLDPRDGSVVATTGKVTSSYNDESLDAFDPEQAAFGSYDGSIGLENGDLLVQQDLGVMRYSLEDDEVVWATDITSIMNSMEGSAAISDVDRVTNLIDGGARALVTLSNASSAEMMILDVKSGKIVGRWNLPADRLNGLQKTPDVVTFDGGLALAHNRYGWTSGSSGSSTAKAGAGFHLGLFSYAPPG